MANLLEGRTAAVFRADIDCRRVYAPIRIANSNVRNIFMARQEIIPIIFIPGIMGSRLREDGSEPYVGKLHKIATPGEFLFSFDELDLDERPVVHRRSRHRSKSITQDHPQP